MKSLYLIMSLLALCCTSESSIAQQNLVPNGSFESKITCPPGASAVTSACSNWAQYTKGTPDYFNVCNTTKVGVPTNDLGSQQAAHGNAYCGFIVHDPMFSAGEYISVALTQPLIVGDIYEVSMSVSRADKSQYATNNIGVYFYDSGAAPGTLNTSAILNFIPQIHYASYGVITDTANWTRLAGLFTADSAYDNIVIGAFYKNGTYSTDTTSGAFDFAYYYIDSVVIKKKTFKIIDYDTLLCAGDTITPEYTVSLPRNNNNTFTLQLSDKNGSFANPLNIGAKNDGSSGIITAVIPKTVGMGTGYRMRMISSSPADTSDTTSVAIRIDNIDSSNVLVNVTDTICSADTLKFTASSGISSATFHWTGPVGFNTNKADTNVISPQVTNSGVYYSTIMFYGCSVKDTFSVLIKPTPVKPIVSNNGPLCAGDTLKLTGSTTSGGVTYSWTGPNSYTSGQQNPVLINSTTAMSGVYTQTAALNGCSRNNTTTVTIKPTPQATTLSSNSPLCDNDTLKLNSTTSTSGVTYSWSGPVSYTSAARNSTRVNLSPSMSGYYKLLLDLNGCTILDSIQATIQTTPATPNVTANNPLCVGDTLKLTATSNNGTTYSWTGPNNFTSAIQNPNRINITLADAGTYIVNATANNCTSPSDSVSVSINPSPFVVILSNKDSICAGDPVTFSALPNNIGGIPTYKWYVNGQQATSTGSTFTTTTLQNNAIVKVDMTEYTKCANPYTDPSNDIQMRVLPWLAPSVSITANPSGPVPPNQYITFTATPNDAGAIPGYQWKRNGNNVVGANGMTWSANTLNDNDSISVQVISNYMCPQPKTDESNGIVVKILTGVGEVSILKNISIYPNPNNGTFTLKGNTLDNKALQIKILNSIGQEVYNKNVQPENKSINETISLKHIASGMYILQISDGVNTTTMRVEVLY